MPYSSRDFSMDHFAEASALACGCAWECACALAWGVPAAGVAGVLAVVTGVDAGVEADVEVISSLTILRSILDALHAQRYAPAKTGCSADRAPLERPEPLPQKDDEQHDQRAVHRPRRHMRHRRRHGGAHALGDVHEWV